MRASGFASCDGRAAVGRAVGSCCSPPETAMSTGQIRLGRSRITTSVVAQDRAIDERGCDHPHQRRRPSLTGGDDPEGQRQEQGQAQGQQRQRALVRAPSPAPDSGTAAGGRPVRGTPSWRRRRRRRPTRGEGAEAAAALGGDERQPGGPSASGCGSGSPARRTPTHREVDLALAPITTSILSPARSSVRSRERRRRTSPRGRRPPSCRPGRAAAVSRRWPGPASRSPDAVPSTTTCSSPMLGIAQQRDRVAHRDDRPDRARSRRELVAELVVEQVLGAVLRDRRGTAAARPPRGRRSRPS